MLATPLTVVCRGGCVSPTTRRVWLSAGRSIVWFGGKKWEVGSVGVSHLAPLDSFFDNHHLHIASFYPFCSSLFAITLLGRCIQKGK